MKQHSNNIQTTFNMNLTTHFTLEELTHSDTAKAKGIDNTPALAQIDNLRKLARNVLEPLRTHFNRPIQISSGYRSPELNKIVGGKNNSQHLLGEAADISIPQQNMNIAKQWLDYIRKYLDFDQLILEHTSTTYWIHVSYTTRHTNRHQYIPNLRK